MNTCPFCGCDQDAGLLCVTDTDRLERDLGEVPALITELDIVLAKEARTAVGGKAGPARERWGYGNGASVMADELSNTLITWARDVSSESWRPREKDNATKSAARRLMFDIDLIRRHAEVRELMDEITDAIERVRQFILGPKNRTIIFVGPCPEPDEHGRPCMGEVNAYIPREDEKPGRMSCTNNSEHSWSSIQWLRIGKRIADLQADIKTGAA